ncbi:YhgE/Pip domain-containing protein [Paenibacillus nasutitermitis]|uniref:ABC-2 type transporter transmembrane domain-containing protein n=1 Tax=Paenibacillus nasutitermitis TaxID=1652958 RepID=A0A917E0J9_9BACL|nr:ABC transporter permease [Paenibacillus nasutitermitis]GGD89457.1 hypothetical protein GCM10010911_55080 [Paenibacillus nasutitermitis]
MKSFLAHKGIISGIFMIVFYQVIMIGIFMSGYSAIPRNIPDISVAIVNDDQQQGMEIAKQIQKELPFHVITGQSLEDARQQLEDRSIHFIMHIPADFTQKLSSQGEQVKLDFYLNQSNPAATNSTVQSVADQITAKISAQVQSQSIQGILQTMQVPKDQSEQMAEGVMTKVAPDMIISNPQPDGMHNQMAPMFLTMATYVGAMIYSMMAVGALNQLKGKLGKWKAFFALQGVHVLLALIAPLVGLTIYFAIHGYGGEVFVKMWLVHALELFAAIQFTSVFCLLLGQGGMLLNLPLLLAQTISSGAVLPQVMMPGFFKGLSHISVMYYTVQLDYNLLFGGGRTAELLLGLGLVGAAALILNVVIHQFKGASKSAPQPLFM